MFTLFKLLFALRLGTMAAFAGPAPISLRAESREAVAESSRHGGASAVSTWGASPASPQWPYAQGSGPAGAPVFVPYRPEDWVSRVADQLHVNKDLGIAQAAMWVLATPVRIDMSPRHVYFTVTLRAP